MDETPFWEFNILDIKETMVPEIKKSHKSNFDLDTIFNTASELKYSNITKHLMSSQLTSPTDNFINYILNEVYSGRKTQNIVEKFREISKKSLNQFISELMNERIKSALETSKPTEQTKTDEKNCL